MDGTVVPTETVRTGDVNGRRFRGLGEGPRPGVLVLHGGGGARGYEGAYAAKLASHGYEVLCVEYFGAPGVREALLRVPLEEFGRAAEWLLDRDEVAGNRVGVVGFSRGGEASLLVGSQFDSIGTVAAYVPSCYVWPAPSWMDGVGENEPTWTLEGEPVEHLPIDQYVTEDDDVGDPLEGDPPGAPTLAIERSSERKRRRATIPVEEIDGPVLLVSGERDVVWPSSRLAERAARRLDDHDHPWPVEYRSFPDAGHAIRVPYRFDGEDPGETHRYGGTHEANAHAAARAWQATLRYLEQGLTEREGGRIPE